MSIPDRPPVALRRVLSFWPLVFYGLSVIVGAGIYVAIGAVIERAGKAAPISFLLSGLAAAATGLCYAELAGRFPEAAGAVAYVRRGFGSNRLALATGAAMTLAVAIAAASIARGAVFYLEALAPLPAALWVVIVIAGFTAVALAGVRESVGLAALLGVVEIAGLLAAMAAGLLASPEWHVAGLVPTGWDAWRGTIAGAFIAFFAFIGFETLANLAEEVRDPQRTLPRGIIAAVAASIALYVAVAYVAVLAGGDRVNPLLGLFEGAGASAFALVAAIAVANGVLVQIVLLARLFYGMARAGELPAVLARVDPRTRTPVAATLLGGAIILAAALLLSFERLLVLANAVTLAVFTLVDLALWRVQRTAAAAPSAAIPRWIPPVAAVLSVTLMLAELAF